MLSWVIHLRILHILAWQFNLRKHHLRKARNVNSNYMITLKNLIIILTIGVLFSCSSNDNKTGQPSASNFKTKDTIISFTGDWICKDYFESINNYKSPRKAQDNSEYIYIPDKTLKQTMMISNFHEGGSVLTILKNTDQFELWELVEDSLTQLIDKIEIVDNKNIKIGTRTFVKFNPIKTDNGPLILEEILLKGIYTNSNGATIAFKNNGQISGLESYKVYEPIIDYFDAAMQVDQIGLGRNRDNLEYFGFKFNKDTLELYKLNCLTFDSTDNMCLEVDLGQLTHKLWKKK